MIYTTQKLMAMRIVRELIQACGPQTMEQLCREMREKLVDCDTPMEAKDYVCYALIQLHNQGDLRIDEASVLNASYFELYPKIVEN